MPPIVVATAFGGPEVLAVVDEPTAAPGPGQVLVEVRAAGVNPIDWKLYSGQMGADRSTLPRRVGFEAAGVVRAVSDGAVGAAGPLAVGDAVIAFRIDGAYAAEIVVPGETLLPKPDTLSFAQAAGLILTGVTAVHLLTATDVAAGETILVHGAAGGVGQMAVQLGRIRGARVIGTASPANHGVLESLGAVPVAYGEGLGERVRVLAPEGVDAALDCVGTDEALDTSLTLVGDRRRIATIANFERGPREGIGVLGGGPGADPGTALRDAARHELVALAAAGRLEIEAEELPLASVAEVHRRAMTGHTRGKVVLRP